ncbi:MAG: methionyl-tRNA formyltransferase [Planctomycetota bacterium]|nr:methionyl-tRNA formyltransferase [Planctomycetota bacterium]
MNPASIDPAPAPPARVVFFGSGAFGLPTLQHLAAAGRIRGVVSQPDKPAGRGGAPTPTPIAAWAREHLPGVPVLTPQSCNTPDIRDAIRALPADAWVVIAFGQKLGPALLADRFAINLHASLLPRWRGAAPINAAVLAGDAETGNSVITLADRMDAGLVLAQSRRPVPLDATAGQLHDQLASDGPALVDSVLAAHAAGTLAPVTQDESLVTLAPKMSKADGWVDFARPAEECRARINGLSPWPGVAVTFRAQPLRLLRATTSLAGVPPQIAHAAVALAHDAAPGTLLSGAEGLVGCAGGTVVRLLEVQAPGRKVVPWRDFANGQRVESQEVLAGGRPSC